MAGNDYAESYPIALLLILPVTVPLIQNLGIEVQRAKNMHHFRSWLYFFIALANLVLSIPLVKSFGGIGSALGTAIALLVGNGFVMNWYYHFRVGLDMRYFWTQILKLAPALGIPVVSGVLVTSLFDTSKLVWFLMGGFIYTMTFVLSMWFMGMNDYERELIAVPIRRAARRFRAALTR